MSEFIHPPEEFTDPDLPTVFLAGPVQGARDWQTDMARRLLRSEYRMGIASPRRTDMDDPAVRAAFDIRAQNEQIDWELRHIKRALNFGVLVINLAAQDVTLDYPAGRAYAQTTRFEAGGAILGMEFYQGRANIALRVDPLYQGGNTAYMRRIAERNDIPVISEEAELFAQILSKLPPPTRSTLS